MREGMAAELMTGRDNPGGKLRDNLAGHLGDYPSTHNFHESDNYVEYTDEGDLVLMYGNE